MDSFNGQSGFHYNLSSPCGVGGDGDGEGFSGILRIHVHHARNLHNICIYDNQDVYAKFSLTYNPDDAVSTRIVNGGGRNPDFGQDLAMPVAHPDAVLKCEIWMLSRARKLMEDQLLGFALVPISLAIGGRVTQCFSLSSTDLFHSPAGTVNLTLSLDPSPASNHSAASNSSITSEVVLLDRKASDSELGLDVIEYSRIEFPDIGVARENQRMVSEYFVPSTHRGLLGTASFLRLGSPDRHPGGDCDMAVNPPEDVRGSGSLSPNESANTSGFLGSTTTSLSDDRNSVDSIGKKLGLCAGTETLCSPNAVPAAAAESTLLAGASPDTPTSKKGIGAGDVNEPSHFCSGREDDGAKPGKPFATPPFATPPFGNIAGSNLEAEQSAMQQHIVDMYMRSMQQFTESLAKMNLPMDVDRARPEDPRSVMQGHGGGLEAEKAKKKDAPRVFYGSRAFF